MTIGMPQPAQSTSVKENVMRVEDASEKLILVPGDPNWERLQEQ